MISQTVFDTTFSIQIIFLFFRFYLFSLCTRASLYFVRMLHASVPHSQIQLLRWAWDTAWREKHYRSWTISDVVSLTFPYHYFHCRKTLIIILQSRTFFCAEIWMKRSKSVQWITESLIARSPFVQSIAARWRLFVFASYLINRTSPSCAPWNFCKRFLIWFSFSSRPVLSQGFLKYKLLLRKRLWRENLIWKKSLKSL